MFKFELDTSSDFDEVVIDESEIESVFNKKEKYLNSLNNKNIVSNEIVTKKIKLQKKTLWSDLTEGDLFILLKHKRPFKYMDLHHFKKFHLILYKNDDTILEYYLSSPKLKYKLHNNVDFKTFMNEILIERGVIVKIESLVTLNEITEEELENEVNVSEFEGLTGQQLLEINEAVYFTSLQSGTDSIKMLQDYDTVTLFIKQIKNLSIKVTVNKNNDYKVKKSEFNDMIKFLIKNKKLNLYYHLEIVKPFNDPKYLNYGRYKIIRLFKKNNEESNKIDIKNTDPVYLAIDYKLKKNVVIKRVDSKFSSEFDYLQNINSEYVLRVLDSFNYKNYTYFVTPYYEFKDLKCCLQSNFINNEYFSDEVIIEIIYQIAEGLSYLHDANNNTNRIVHRDLKPENIYVERFYFKEYPPDIKLSIGDFGHSEIFEDSVNHKFDSLTGTEIYQAPEFHNNNKLEYTFNVDLWCLGFILYILLSLDNEGKHFNGKLVATNNIIIEDLIEKKLSKINIIFKEILINTLQKDPIKRTLKAVDIVNKLNDYRQQYIKLTNELDNVVNNDDDNEELTLENCEDELINNEEYVLSILTLNGLELQFVNDEMKNNRNIVLTAVKENGNALKFASFELRNDKEIVREAIKKNPLSFQYASSDNRDITLTAIKQNGLALEYVDDSLQNDKEILLTSVLQTNGSALQFISTNVYCYKEIIFNAALQNIECLKFSNEQFNNDLFKKLILEYSKNSFRTSKDRDCFFIQQVEKNANYLQYVFSNEICIEEEIEKKLNDFMNREVDISTQFDLITVLAKKNSTILNWIPFKFRIKYLNHLIINGSLTEEIKFFLKNLQVHQSTSLLHPLQYQYASDKMKNDPFLVITLAMNRNLVNRNLDILQFIPNDFQFTFNLIYYYFGYPVYDKMFIKELLFLISNLSEKCIKTTFYTFKNNHILLDDHYLFVGSIIKEIIMTDHYLFEEVINGISDESIKMEILNKVLNEDIERVEYFSKKLQVEFINVSIRRGSLTIIKLNLKNDKYFNTFLEYTEQELETLKLFIQYPNSYLKEAEYQFKHDILLINTLIIHKNYSALANHIPSSFNSYIEQRKENNEGLIYYKVDSDYVLLAINNSTQEEFEMQED
ncbi:hypothetical protein ABK040_011225 [Willaertia magna]